MAALAPGRGQKQRYAGLVRGLFAAAVRLFSWLPLPVAWRMADALGVLTAACGGTAAHITRINLALCFPVCSAADREKLVRTSLSHTWRLLLEAGPLNHWPAPRLRRLLVKEVGRFRIEGPLRRKQPVLLLIPHYGNWEFLCYVLGGLGAVALYEPPRWRALQAPLLSSRQRFGMRLAPTTSSGLRTAYRALAAGGLVCILPDQVPSADAGVFAPFFGRPALTMTLAHRMARNTGAEVLIGSARRVRDGFEALYEPLMVGGCPDRPEEFAQALNQATETLVRRDPAQYQWEYKRFRRQPPGSPNPYPK